MTSLFALTQTTPDAAHLNPTRRTVVALFVIIAAVALWIACGHSCAACVRVRLKPRPAAISPAMRSKLGQRAKIDGRVNDQKSAPSSPPCVSSWRGVRSGERRAMLRHRAPQQE